MMSNLRDWQRQIIKGILEKEGGVSNDDADRGGYTNYGITLPTLRAYRRDPDLSAADVGAVTAAEAEAIYASLYAAPFVFVEDPMVFELLVNTAVQHGLPTLVRFLQGWLKVTVDGSLGPVTQRRMQEALKAAPHHMVGAISAFRCRIYGQLCRHPEQLKFAGGWFNRLAADLS